MGVTERIAHFVAGLRFSDVPADVVDTIRFRFMDTIGCLLAGCSFAESQRVAALSAEMNHTGTSTVVGYGMRAHPLQTALVHGVMAHSADYDDVSWGMVGHPSAPVISALLPLAESTDASGTDLATAYVAGVEVEVTLGLDLNPTLYDAGWHATGVLGVLGAAAGAARILELNPGQTAHAIGIAASLAGGLRQNFGSMVKALHVGKAASSGVMAALLARSGFTASHDVLDGKLGFSQALSRRGDFPSVQTLGQVWKLREPGVVVKQYPSCGATQQALDAILSLVKCHDIRPGDVEAIAVGLAPAALMPLQTGWPQTGLDGKFSLPFCMAVAVQDRRVGLDAFTDARVHDPDVVSLMKRVQTTLHPDLRDCAPNSNRASAAIVQVTMCDGRVVVRRVDCPAGAPENPLRENAFVAKFADCAGHVLPAWKVAIATDLLNQLPALKTVGDMISHLVP